MASEPARVDRRLEYRSSRDIPHVSGKVITSTLRIICQFNVISAGDDADTVCRAEAGAEGEVSFDSMMLPAARSSNSSSTEYWYAAASLYMALAGRGPPSYPHHVAVRRDRQRATPRDDPVIAEEGPRSSVQNTQSKPSRAPCSKQVTHGRPGTMSAASVDDDECDRVVTPSSRLLSGAGDSIVPSRSMTEHGSTVSLLARWLSQGQQSLVNSSGAVSLLDTGGGVLTSVVGG